MRPQPRVMGTDAEIARLQALSAHIQRKQIVNEGSFQKQPEAGPRETRKGTRMSGLAVVGRGLPTPSDVAAAQQRARRRHRKRLARIVADQWLWVSRDRLAALPRRAALQKRKLRVCFQVRRRQLAAWCAPRGVLLVQDAKTDSNQNSRAARFEGHPVGAAQTQIDLWRDYASHLPSCARRAAPRRLGCPSQASPHCTPASSPGRAKQPNSSSAERSSPDRSRACACA